MALDFLYHKTNKDPRYNPYNRMWVSKELWTSTWLAQMSVYQPGVVVDPLTLPSSRMCPPPLAPKPGGRTRLSRCEPGHNAKARRDTQHLLTDPLYIDMLGGNMKTSIKKCTKCGGAGWVCLPACCFLLCVLPCCLLLCVLPCMPGFATHVTSFTQDTTYKRVGCRVSGVEFRIPAKSYTSWPTAKALTHRVTRCWTSPGILIA